MKWTQWGTALSGWPWQKHNSFQGASSLQWYADRLFHFNCVVGIKKARIQPYEWITTICWKLCSTTVSVIQLWTEYSLQISNILLRNPSEVSFQNAVMMEVSILLMISSSSEVTWLANTTKFLYGNLIKLQSLCKQLKTDFQVLFYFKIVLDGLRQKSG